MGRGKKLNGGKEFLSYSGGLPLRLQRDGLEDLAIKQQESVQGSVVASGDAWRKIPRLRGGRKIHTPQKTLLIAAGSGRNTGENEEKDRKKKHEKVDKKWGKQ